MEKKDKNLPFSTVKCIDQKKQKQGYLSTTSFRQFSPSKEIKIRRGRYGFINCITLIVGRI